MMVRVIDDFAYNQPAFEYTVKYFLPVIIINIFRIYSASKNMSIAANSNMIIGQIENYIQKNIHSKVSLSELAKIHNITPRHLCRLFKKHTGMTFTEFANRMRAEKLKDELVSTSSEHRSMYSYVRLSIDRCTLRTSEHRSMYKLLRLTSIDVRYGTLGIIDVQH